MKLLDKMVAPLDKALERFDPLKKAEKGTGGQRDRYYDKTGVAKWRTVPGSTISSAWCRWWPRRPCRF